MYKDVEIIDELVQAHGPEFAQRCVERIIRVPEAWEALREPEFLRQALKASGGQPLFPSLLTELALGETSSPNTPPSRDLDDEAQASPTEIMETAKKTLELRRIDQETGAQDLIEFITGASREWHSAFICAWPNIADQPFLLTALVEQEPGLCSLIARTLLAYMDTQQAVEELLALESNAAFKMLPHIKAEPHLHAALKAELSELKNLFNPDANGHVERAAEETIILSQIGRSADANLTARQAWENAARQSAQVADSLAEVAREDRDPVLEAEACSQSIDAYSTPARRAAYAHSLVKLGRCEDALKLVRDGESLDEIIAAGLVFQAMQDIHSAGLKLNHAAQMIIDVKTGSKVWLRRLAEALVELGFSVQAILVYQRLIDLYPGQTEFHIASGVLSASIGDFDSSVQHAAIATALAREDLSARELLARGLEQLGKLDQAVSQWAYIAELDHSKNIDLGNCALSAGDADTAQIAADRLLESDPENVSGRILLGRALSETGRYPEAVKVLKEVTARAPDNADGWIALASSIEAAEGTESSGGILMEALHALPDNPELHVARAKWLKAVDRIADALNHTTAALSAHAERTDWQLVHADLLARLGRLDEVVSSLEPVISAEPANWPAKEQLAKAFTQMERAQEALELVESAPDGIDPHSALFVGRTLAEAGSNTEHFEEAVRKLEYARTAGITDEELDFWAGISNLKQSKFEAALVSLQRYLEEIDGPGVPHYLEAVTSFAESALRAGEPTLAQAKLEEARLSFPTSFELLETLSDVQFSVGDTKKALEIAREALELDPESPPAMRLYRRAAERAGQLQQAFETQQMITERCPDATEDWIDLARLADRIDERAVSRDALATAIVLGKDDAGLLSDASDVAKDIGVIGLEIKLLRRAAALENDCTAHQAKLAKAAARNGDLETAAEAWLVCANKAPKDVATLLPAANSLWKLNRRSAALGLFQQAVAVDPDDPSAHFELGQALLAMEDIERGLDEIKAAVSLKSDDSALWAQSASLLARYAGPAQGLEVLNDSPTKDKHPAISEARAECLWLDGQSSEAVTALNEIPPSVPLTAKGHALRTLMLVASGDLEAASDEFSQIDARAVHSDLDLEWAVKAGGASGAIRRTFNLIDEVRRAQPQQPEILLTELKARFEIENIYWVLSTLGNSGAWDEYRNLLERNPNRIEELINEAGMLGARADSLQVAHDLQELSSGISRAETYKLRENVHGHWMTVLQHTYAIALLRANRPIKAIAALTNTPTEPYDGSFHNLLVGLAYSNTDQVEQAKETFALSTGARMHRALARYFEARMWEKAENFEAAISAMNDALTIQPEEPIWHSSLATLYEASGQAYAALPHLQQAAELAPSDGDILVALARAYHTNGQLGEAEELYARTLQKQTAAPIVWKEAGVVALARGDNERAESWFQRARSMLPGDPGCVIGSARAAQRLGNSKQALDRARKAFDMAPDDPEVLAGLGDILAENGSLDKAIQVYDRALRISNNSPEVRVARSNLLMSAGRPQEAITDLELVVEATQDEHRAWGALANAHASCGEYEKGLHAAQNAVMIAPRNIDYRLQLATICRQAGQLDQALEILSELVQSEPNRGDVAREKARVHEERREVELAIDAYNRALAINSQDPEAIVHAAQLLKQIKAYEEAGELLERGTKLLPDDADLHQQLAAIRALQFVHGQRIIEQVAAS